MLRNDDVKSTELNQIITHLMQLLGYDIQNGVCKGYSIVSMLMFFSNNIKYFDFCAQYIFHENKSLIQKIINIEKITNLNPYYKFSDEQKLVQNIKLIFDEIHKYQNKTDSKIINETNSLVTPYFNQLINYNQLAQQGSLVKVKAWNGAYTLDELEMHLSNLTNSLHALPIVFTLDGGIHQICICYDPTTDVCIAIDPNQKDNQSPIITIPSKDSRTIAKFIKNAFFNENITIFETNIYALGNDKLAVANLLDNMMLSDSFIKRHKVTSEKAKYKTKLGVSLAYIAASYGDADTITAIGVYGSDFLSVSTCNGSTPLFISAQNGHANVINMLALYSVDLTELRNDGYSALHIAANNGHIDVIKALASHKVDLNLPAKNNYKRRPIHYAVQQKQIETVKLLENLKADLYSPSADGCTPLALARYIGNTEIINILLSHSLDLPSPYMKMQ